MDAVASEGPHSKFIGYRPVFGEHNVVPLGLTSQKPS
jgi:hypothetical protein